ncbi:MAG TPA: hypothetical protein VMC61_03425, partial [Methanocella sp.]|nr:hypothetical protein [Methanocella sp.]
MKDLRRAIGLISQGLVVDDRSTAGLHGKAKTLEPHMDKARAHMSKGDYSSVVGELKKATFTHPDDPEAFYDLGVALVRSGKLDEAM